MSDRWKKKNRRILRVLTAAFIMGLSLGSGTDPSQRTILGRKLRPNVRWTGVHLYKSLQSTLSAQPTRNGRLTIYKSRRGPTIIAVLQDGRAIKILAISQSGQELKVKTIPKTPSAWREAGLTEHPDNVTSEDDWEAPNVPMDCPSGTHECTIIVQDEMTGETSVYDWCCED
jgi:hypothetical protein